MLNSSLCDRFSPGAKYFTSSSRDGSVKLWDGVSNKCVNTFHKAHGGAEVCSVLFSRNGKVIVFFSLEL